MRKLAWIAIVGAALAGTGLAVAHGFDSKSVTPVSVQFTATTPSNVDTRTCTANGNTYTLTKATYTGTASSATGDTNLNGPITLDTQSLIVTPANVGIVFGKLEIGSGDNDTKLHLDSVYSSGNVAGWAEGHSGTPHTQLQGNLSAGFSSATGFTSGKLGGGTSGGNAVEIARGGCEPPKPTPPVKPERIEAHGALTIGSGTVTVAGVTCNVPASLSAKVGGFKAGDQVEITCTVSSGTKTLEKIEGKHGK